MKKKKGIRGLVPLLVGVVITAASFPLFFIPNDIAPGGISGISTLIHALCGVPVGAMSALLNAPLFLLSFRRMGRGFAFRSLFAMLASSALIDLLPFPPVTSDPMLAAIFGGVLLGAGVGLVLRSGATTGGTDMAALLIHERFPVLTIGGILLALDCCVVVASGFVFSVLSMMYALISIYITTQVMDKVALGLESAKAFFVFSMRSEEIAGAILTDMRRGATLLHSKGAFSGQERDVLLCVVTRLEIPRFKAIVKDIDPESFVMVTDVHEAMGEGFTIEPIP